MCIFTVYWITKCMFLCLLCINHEEYLPVLRLCLGFICIVAIFLYIVVSVSAGFACSCSAPVLWENPSNSVTCYIRVSHPWFDVSDGGFLRCWIHMLLCRNLQSPPLHSNSSVCHFILYFCLCVSIYSKAIVKAACSHSFEHCSGSCPPFPMS